MGIWQACAGTFRHVIAVTWMLCVGTAGQLVHWWIWMLGIPLEVSSYAAAAWRSYAADPPRQPAQVPASRKARRKQRQPAAPTSNSQHPEQAKPAAQSRAVQAAGAGRGAATTTRGSASALASSTSTSTSSLNAPSATGTHCSSHCQTDDPTTSTNPASTTLEPAHDSLGSSSNGSTTCSSRRRGRRGRRSGNSSTSATTRSSVPQGCSQPSCPTPAPATGLLDLPPAALEQLLAHLPQQDAGRPAAAQACHSLRAAARSLLTHLDLTPPQLEQLLASPLPFHKVTALAVCLQRAQPPAGRLQQLLVAAVQEQQHLPSLQHLQLHVGGIYAAGRRCQLADAAPLVWQLPQLQSLSYRGGSTRPTSLAAFCPAQHVSRATTGAGSSSSSWVSITNNRGRARGRGGINAIATSMSPRCSSSGGRGVGGGGGGPCCAASPPPQLSRLTLQHLQLVELPPTASTSSHRPAAGGSSVRAFCSCCNQGQHASGLSQQPDAACLLRPLRHYPLLRELRLVEVSLPPHGLAALGAAAPALTSLELCRIRQPRLQLQHLSGLQQLQQLTLCGITTTVQLSAAELQVAAGQGQLWAREAAYQQQLAEVLAGLQQLRTLKVWRCKGLGGPLAGALPELSRLTGLCHRDLELVTGALPGSCWGGWGQSLVKLQVAALNFPQQWPYPSLAALRHLGVSGVCRVPQGFWQGFAPGLQELVVGRLPTPTTPAAAAAAAVNAPAVLPRYCIAGLGADHQLTSLQLLDCSALEGAGPPPPPPLPPPVAPVPLLLHPPPQQPPLAPQQQPAAPPQDDQQQPAAAEPGAGHQPATAPTSSSTSSGGGSSGSRGQGAGPACTPTTPRSTSSSSSSSGGLDCPCESPPPAAAAYAFVMGSSSSPRRSPGSEAAAAAAAAAAAGLADCAAARRRRRAAAAAATLRRSCSNASSTSPGGPGDVGSPLPSPRPFSVGSSRSPAAQQGTSSPISGRSGGTGEQQPAASSSSSAAGQGVQQQEGEATAAGFQPPQPPASGGGGGGPPAAVGARAAAAAATGAAAAVTSCGGATDATDATGGGMLGGSPPPPLDLPNPAPHQLVSNCPELRTLALHCGGVQQLVVGRVAQGSALLAQLPSCCCLWRHLQDLSLRHMPPDFTPGRLTALLRPHVTSLTRLELTQCPGLSWQGLAAAPALPALRQLTVAGCSGVTVVGVAALMGRCPRLQEVTLQQLHATWAARSVRSDPLLAAHLAQVFSVGAYWSTHNSWRAGDTGWTRPTPAAATITSSTEAADGGEDSGGGINPDCNSSSSRGDSGSSGPHSSSSSNSSCSSSKAAGHSHPGSAAGSRPSPDRGHSSPQHRPADAAAPGRVARAAASSPQAPLLGAAASPTLPTAGSGTAHAAGGGPSSAHISSSSSSSQGEGSSWGPLAWARRLGLLPWGRTQEGAVPLPDSEAPAGAACSGTSQGVDSSSSPPSSPAAGPQAGDTAAQPAGSTTAAAPQSTLKEGGGGAATAAPGAASGDPGAAADNTSDAAAAGASAGGGDAAGSAPTACDAAASSGPPWVAPQLFDARGKLLGPPPEEPAWEAWYFAVGPADRAYLSAAAPGLRLLRVS